MYSGAIFGWYVPEKDGDAGQIYPADSGVYWRSWVYGVDRGDAAGVRLAERTCWAVQCGSAGGAGRRGERVRESDGEAEREGGISDTTFSPIKEIAVIF